MNTQVFLLAAGQGRRAGGPKAWLPYKGKTLLERQIEFLTGQFKPQNIFISIQKSWQSRCRNLNPGIRWVSVDPELPPMASLLELIKASAENRWAFLYHVDMPVWEEKLFQTLKQAIPAAETSSAEAIIPTFQNKKGHPVLLSPASLASIFHLNPAKDRLDLWLRTRKVDLVKIPFSCIHANWNSPPPHGQSDVRRSFIKSMSSNSATGERSKPKCS